MSEKVGNKSAVDAVLASVVADAKADVADIAQKQGFIRDAAGKETPRRSPVNEAQKRAAAKDAVNSASDRILAAALNDVIAGL